LKFLKEGSFLNSTGSVSGLKDPELSSDPGIGVPSPPRIEPGIAGGASIGSILGIEVAFSVMRLSL
jgi:hypothetical protein